MYKILVLAVLVSSLNGLDAYAQTYATSSAHAEVHGSISVAPNYKGTSDQLEGTINLEKGTLDFSVLLKTLKTGNSTRDKHMYGALEVSKYPKVTFEGTIEGLNPKLGEKQKVTVAGAFTLHGQTKHLEIPGTVERTAGGLKFTASFSIMITDYGIERPSKLFLTVDDKHIIEVSGTAKEI